MLVFGPMTVATDGNNTRPLQVLEAKSVRGVEELFVCGQFQFGTRNANLLLSFADPIDSLTFTAAQTSTSENFSILVHSDPSAVIGTDIPDFVQTWDADGTDASVPGGPNRRQFTLDRQSPFDRVFINNTSDFAAFGNFTFEPVAAVPLPLSGALLLTGLGALGFSRNRVRR